MIEVHAAQEVLVGFALAAMLGHGQAGRRFQYVARPLERTGVQCLAGEALLAGGICRLGFKIPGCDNGDGR